MQSKTEDFMVELEAYNIQKSHPRSFKLYEEYSQRNIAETIRIRKENFDKANLKTRRELEIEVEREVENFRIWLKETKNLDASTAHYYSMGLKGLLLGLPIGVQVACLFGTILDTQARE